MKGRIIKANGFEAEVEIAGFEDAKRQAGIEFALPVKLPDHVYMLVEEDGMLINLPVNEKASKIARFTILGDVIIIPEEGIQ